MYLLVSKIRELLKNVGSNKKLPFESVKQVRSAFIDVT